MLGQKTFSGESWPLKHPSGPEIWLGGGNAITWARCWLMELGGVGRESLALKVLVWDRVWCAPTCNHSNSPKGLAWRDAVCCKDNSGEAP